MNKYLFFILIGALSFSFFSCAQDKKTEKEEILAKINDYDLILKEFEYLLASDMEMDEDIKLTRESKKAFIERLIRKEILIQEAKKLKLDRQKDFIRTIERYWESTLIRNLMELRGKDIRERIYVSEEEIKGRYEKISETEEKPLPLENIREDIVKDIRASKERKKLREWIDDLRKEAEIKINEDLLYGK